MHIIYMLIINIVLTLIVQKVIHLYNLPLLSAHQGSSLTSDTGSLTLVPSLSLQNNLLTNNNVISPNVNSRY